MTNQNLYEKKNVRAVTLIPLVALVGFGSMYLFTYFRPLPGPHWLYALSIISLIIVGLAVPYLMLKLGFHEAHLRNGQEKELKLEDMPKDQQQLKKTKQ